MEKFAAYQIQNLKPEEVLDLDFHGWKSSDLSPTHKSFLESFTNLESLSFSQAGLRTLQNFPILPKLIRLDLSSNKLRSNLDNLQNFPNLMQLSLTHNQIESISALSPIFQLRLLVCLEVEHCPVALTKDYRANLFAVNASLQIIDGIDRNGNEGFLSDVDPESELSEESEEEDSLIYLN